MGIPKAFRWLSERYPLISQLIQENRIPEFDNLYLDMNGIIHNCSHNNNEDVHFRISEEQIFLQVFAYIEHLFSKIKPKKLFFMAIDGVAPRAKMNQQRSRRFRSAKESNDRILEAKRKGEDIPEDIDDAFQSNMITPGTPFMARLTAQLKYFINKKISEDADWRGVQVVLSGHEVPGEGEHKIMEYIRLAKAQPQYNPNTRHCLYGLDADLIMLGLLSHDPHFCLLREEVLFGPARAKSAGKGLESTNFFLMHLSLLREYLDIEFADLKNVMPASNPYDLEHIIDDFILLAIFIGNDFLPHLPGLHINEGAFNLLFGIYKEIIPRAGGYLNEHGVLNLPRLQLVLDKLADFEKETFEEESADAEWIRMKNAGKEAEKSAQKSQKRNAITKGQKKMLAAVKTFVFSNLDSPSLSARLEFPASNNAADREFLQKLTDDLKLDIAFDEFDTNDEPVIVVRLSEDVVEMLLENSEQSPEPTSSGTPEDQEDAEDDGGEWEDVDEEEDDDIEKEVDQTTKAVKNVDLNTALGNRQENEEVAEWRTALERVFAKYEKAPNARESQKSQADHDRDYQAMLERKVAQWKKEYYLDKLEFDISTDPASLQKMAFTYIEGLQWVLHYYYDGVASWSWFYPYHYSPKISDLVKVADMKFDFDLNVPFKPFEQLMGVMPELSASLLPIPYRDLMTNSESPIKDFYPSSFEQDMNGKKAEWEAIVKIPFIDANRLLKAMRTKESQLTEDERQRNSFGTSFEFSYDPTLMTVYPSSLPGFFPDLLNSHCKMEVFNLPTLGGLRLVKGLCEGALLGKDVLPGFPSMYTLPVHPRIAFHAVNVFQTDSRNESVIMSVDDIYHGQSVDQVASACLGKQVFAGWPFLQEAKVVGVSDEDRKYTLGPNGALLAATHSPDRADKWRKAAHKIEHVYSKRFGVILDGVELVLHVQLLKGLKRTDDGALVKEWDHEDIEQAIQTVVMSREQQDPRYVESPPRPVEQEYPTGDKVFFLGDRFFGSPATVYGHSNDKLTIQVAYFTTDAQELQGFAQLNAKRSKALYYPSPHVSKQLRIGALTLSKITSGLMIDQANGQRTNVGLNLKFEARGQKVLGYAQRNERGWEYSQKAIDLLKEYISKFPEIPAALDGKHGKDVTSASAFFPEDTEKRLDELKKWIKEKGVRDFEKVSLYSDQMEAEEVKALEQVQNDLASRKSIDQMKQAILQNIPRRLLLKPAHAVHRLQNQEFAVGDRVIAVGETGSVPLAVKGVVVGMQAGFIDVLFDIPFMGGTTLGNRCSNYRGMSVTPTAILNLSNPQLLQAKGGAPPPARMTGHASNGQANGSQASATQHASYRGVAHRGHAAPRGHDAGRGGQVDIPTRSGMTGKFAAAASGNKQEAYFPPQSRQSILQSALRGGGTLNGNQQNQQDRQNQQNQQNQQQIYAPGPRVDKQDYSRVAPPAALQDAQSSFGHRGRGRGGRGGLGHQQNGGGHTIARGGHSGQGPLSSALGQAGETLGANKGANGHSTEAANGPRGARARAGIRGMSTRGDRGGRGKAGGKIPNTGPAPGQVS